MSEASQFEVLERKITQAIEKVAQLKEERKTLQERLTVMEAQNESLQRELDRMKKGSARSQSPDFNRIRGKVDSLLAKIESLEL